MKKFNLVGKGATQKTTFKVGDVEVGSDMLLIAGPCSVESREQIFEIAKAVKAGGANMLRGGAYKPRTSPYSFQGLGRTGLELLREAGDSVGLPIISEAVDTRDVFLVASFVDVIQIGARNMQNYALLREVGRTDKPVMLKRGMNATIEEWLYCAEYILYEGNSRVMLCERGIRSYETYTRNTFDLSAIALAKEMTHLPVIADPSHATGVASLVEPMSLSAIVAGADGCMVEVHNNPPKALSDGEQSLTPSEFETLAEKMRRLWEFMGKLSTHCIET